jgi:hypothetical protein
MLLDDDDDFSWLPYQISAADYVPYREKIAREEETYFVPSVVEGAAVLILFACFLFFVLFILPLNIRNYCLFLFNQQDSVGQRRSVKVLAYDN